MAKDYTALYYLLLSLSLVPWMFIQFDTFVNADAFWLTYGANLLLQGASMSERVFDTNPPLCFLIFSPAVLLQKIFGMSIAHSITTYTILLIVVFAAIIALQTRSWSNDKNFANFIVLGYIIFMTFLSVHQFGQKDHLTALALPALAIGQYGITMKKPHLRSANIVLFIISAPLVMAKPHYVLLPMFLILHRLYKWRSLSALWQSDVVIYTVIGLLNTFTTLFYFTDYITVILPLIRQTYLQTPYIDQVHFFSGILIFLTTMASIFAYFSEAEKGEKQLFPLIAFGAFFSIFCYWVQLKGFSYHVLPFLSFFACFLGGLAYVYIPHKFRTYVLIITTFILAPSSIAILQSMRAHEITGSKDKYRSGPIAELIKDNGQSHSFYIENNSTHNVMQWAAHNNLIYASRFPQNWFTYYLERLPKDQRIYYTDVLAKAVAADIHRDKPGVIIFIDDPAMVSMLDVFADNESFKEMMQNYERADTILSNEIVFRSKETFNKEDIQFAIFKKLTSP